ncbi:hypothetical protein HDU93_009154 [Gonapodya sp. JEL0774]|nr:hypothetical protein HDU93_009154 [Gonapodya sp. JEL0774]
MAAGLPSRQRVLDALSSLDLTSLSPETDTDEFISDLCMKASSGPVPCAAVCVLPKFVSVAKRVLAGSPVKVATVVNFPEGIAVDSEVSKQSELALADGVDEIDVVWNWRKFSYGDENGALAPVQAVCDTIEKSGRADVIVKVIVETAALEADSVSDAAHLILHRLCGYGSDSALPATPDMAEDSDYVSPFSPSARKYIRFLKTSTGQLKLSPSDKTPVSYENASTGATPEAVRYFVDAINETGAKEVGVKVSGGVRSVDDAVKYLNLVTIGLKGGIKGRFRIGASNVYSKLVAAAATVESSV